MALSAAFAALASDLALAFASAASAFAVAAFAVAAFGGGVFATGAVKSLRRVEISAAMQAWIAAEEASTDAIA